jgi:drug/metabolite transporter (DMT)-like permease
MELWIPITITAALLQNVRMALQKQLNTELSTAGTTYVRSLYGLPLSFLYVLVLTTWFNISLPDFNTEFVFYCILGGSAQILGTLLLVRLFRLRNFVVGITYSKTETVQAAVFGTLILGDAVSSAATFAILLSFFGIILVSASGAGSPLRQLTTGWSSQSGLFGVLSGGLFGISAVSYRAASLSLGHDSVAISAAFTLVVVLTFQSVVMSVYLTRFEPGQIADVLKSWRFAIWIGITSMLGSVGWFTAMTLQNAAYVRAVGQIELIFTLLISRFIFHESMSRFEITGMLLVIAGILVLIL